MRLVIDAQHSSRVITPMQKKLFAICLLGQITVPRNKQLDAIVAGTSNGYLKLNYPILTTETNYSDERSFKTENINDTIV